MLLKNLFEHIYTRVNKDQSGNTYGINRFNIDCEAANLELFSYLYGLPQGYRPGQPLPPVSYEVTQRITDALKTCKVVMGGRAITDPSPLVVSNGIATIPNDYVHHSRMNYAFKDINNCNNPKVDYRVIEVITDAEWSSRIANDLRNKNADRYPYCVYNSTYIEFTPAWDNQNVIFTYLRSPKKPFLDYVKKADTSYYYLAQGQVYNLEAGDVYRTGQTTGQVISQTQELEWSPDSHLEFANLIVGYISENLRSQFLYQTSEQRKAKGI